MTKQEAKELSLATWNYLARHPEISHKGQLPGYLWSKLRDLPSACPLCYLFHKAPYCCSGCPLDAAGEKCESRKSAYQQWISAEIDERAERKDAAEQIVSILEMWEPDKPDPTFGEKDRGVSETGLELWIAELEKRVSVLESANRIKEEL